MNPSTPSDIERARERRRHLDELRVSEELIDRAKQIVNFACDLSNTPAEVGTSMMLGAVVAGTACGMGPDELVAMFTSLATELKLHVVAQGFDATEST